VNLEQRRRVAALLAAAAAACPAAAGAGTGAETAVEMARAPGSAPDLGVESPARRGFYVETSLGIFGTVGGSRGISLAQPSLGMAVGRHLGEAAAIFLQLGIGSSRASCFDGPLSSCAGADSFGATFAELGLQYAFPVLPRLRLSAEVLGGLTVLSPSPLADPQGGAVPGTISGPHLGLGLGLDYDTRLDHFAVGFDVLGRHSRVGRPGGGTFGLTSFAMMPRIKYVF
jgi:hypothetical protein